MLNATVSFGVKHVPVAVRVDHSVCTVCMAPFMPGEAELVHQHADGHMTCEHVECSKHPEDRGKPGL